MDFVLPPHLEASEPPEARGLDRDQVRLLIGWRNRPDVVDTVFHQLPNYLEAGDLLVVNNSATLPAALAARGPQGEHLELHLSTLLSGEQADEPAFAEPALDDRALDEPALDDRALDEPAFAERWVVELRRLAAPASQPYSGGRTGMVLELAGGARAELLAPYGSPGRLWMGALSFGTSHNVWLARHGRPIRYRYVPAEWPLDYYQTVFAQHAGSAEMPSAARPFSARLVTDLVSQGVNVAPVTLHCGLSSLEAHEAPAPEHFWVPPSTADLVNQTRQRGRRVIAVGTTVVRALESVAGSDGEVHATGSAGEWTELVITAGRGVSAIDGMITGWHEPAASHLAMLEAVAGTDLLVRSYRAALARGYLWHEFGDSHLILP